MHVPNARRSLACLAASFGLLVLPALAQVQNPSGSTMQVNDLAPGQEHLTPAQMPPKEPVVSFQNGIITVDADNSTLSAALHAVAKATGIKLNGNAPEDRIFGKFGPGSLRDVITQLFSGFHIDYILQGGADPNSVASITINSRGALNADMLTTAPAQPQVPQQVQTPAMMQIPNYNPATYNPAAGGIRMGPVGQYNGPINSDTAGGQEPENTNGYSAPVDQSGPEENGYQPVHTPPPPPPTQQQLLDQLHQMQSQIPQQH